jgi:hypothetical protein
MSADLRDLAESIKLHGSRVNIVEAHNAGIEALVDALEQSTELVVEPKTITPDELTQLTAKLRGVYLRSPRTGDALFRQMVLIVLGKEVRRG